MIRKLTEADRSICLDFVTQKPAENLFIIGDIELYGFDSHIQELWGDFDDHNNLRAVLLRYRSNYIVYGLDDYDAQGFAAIIDEDQRPTKMVSGISTIVAPVVEALKNKPVETKETYYAKCENLNTLTVPQVTIKRLSDSDLSKLEELHNKVFTPREGRGEELKESLESGSSRGFYIEEDGKFVSSAMTSAENSLSAMVIAVCTLPGYEKRGYATAIMTHLCRELLAEGKYLCLFYDNPAAGAIYKRLGFKDIGKWMMHTF